MAGLGLRTFEIKQGVRQGGVLPTPHYKLYNNNLLLLLQALRVGMSVGHIDCSCSTCADDVALLAKFLLFLQILLMVVKYFLGRERYGINTSKSTEVVLNDVTKEPDEGKLCGTDEIERSDSETHLGVDRNCAATVDVEARAQTGRRTMYAIMNGCSGVSAPLIAHLWRVYALPQMAYGLEVFILSSKAIYLMQRLEVKQYI